MKKILFLLPLLLLFTHSLLHAKKPSREKRIYRKKSCKCWYKDSVYSFNKKCCYSIDTTIADTSSLNSSITDRIIVVQTRGVSDIDTIKRYTTKINKLAVERNISDDTLTMRRCYKIDTTGVSQYPGFTLLGALYNNMPYIKDDNPPGFTQTYLRLSFLRNCRKEYEPYKSRAMTPYLLRNFFGQVLYSANVPDIKPYYGYKDGDSSKLMGYVNRLDLYQYANLHLTLMQNLITFVSNDRNYWKTTIYIDGLAELNRTNVSDTINDETRNVNSWLLGASTKARFKGLRENKLFRNIAIEPYGQIFWINPLTNSFNYELNVQQANQSDMIKPENTGKLLTVPQQLYKKVGIVFMYSLQQKQKDEQVEDENSVFLHLAYTSNFYSSSNYYFNSYFQAQLGLRINISTLIGKLSETDTQDKAEKKEDTKR